MHADSLNLRIAKKTMIENWKSRKSNYAKERLLQSKNHFK